METSSQLHAPVALPPGNKPPVPTGYKSRDSSVGIALGYGLDDRGSRVRFQAGAGNFSLHHRVQNGSGAHPASYPMGTRSSFSGGKAAGAWSWPLTSICAEVKEWVELYLHSPNTPSWRGVQLKHRDSFTFTFIFTHWIRCWVNPRAGLDVVAKRKKSLSCRELKHCRPAYSLVTVLNGLPRFSHS
jgi:hypothetical protein